MKHFQQSGFQTSTVGELPALVTGFKERGFEFVQICATTIEGGCELLYAFRDPEQAYAGLTGVIVPVSSGVGVASVSELYPGAFVFENEAHDLFGIHFEGISIDYDGHFYTVPVAFPMNPQTEEDRAAVKAAEERGGQQ